MSQMLVISNKQSNFCSCILLWMILFSIMSKRGLNNAFSIASSKKQATMNGFFSRKTISDVISTNCDGDENRPSKKTKSSHSAKSFISDNISTKDKDLQKTNVEEEDSKYKVFCDLDGVLCDFDAGVRKLFNGKGPDEIFMGHMWARISKTDLFYENLEWTSDGRELWDAIKHMNPDILTGVPNNQKFRAQKANWCKRELGVKTNHVDMAGKKGTHQRISGSKQKNVVNVITCWSKNKHMESGENA